jgi:hypothetical protein
LISIETRESVMASLSVPRAGWEADRPVLPQQTERRILEKLPPQLGDEALEGFTVHLRLIFALAAEAQLVALPSVPRKARTGAVKTLPGQRLRRSKFNSLQLKQIEALRERYGKFGTAGYDAVELNIYFEDLMSCLAIAGVGRELFYRHIGQQLRSMRTRVAQREAFPKLGRFLEELALNVKKNVKPGRSEPALELLVEALARLYNCYRGKYPGRTYDYVTEEEKGDFLDICREMSEAVIDRLPPNFPRGKPRDLVKIIRRVVKKLKNEPH